MLNKSSLTKVSRIVFLVVFILINVLITISKTQEEDESDLKRDFIRMDKIKPEQFAQHRGNNKSGIKTLIHKKAKSKVVSQEVEVEKEVASLGFTLWKFRKTEIDDEHKERIPTIEGTEDLTPERVEGNPLKIEDGAKVRFSVEIPVEGYLYVFDQDKYADGSYGNPYLVYPIKGAVNKLEDNNRIEISQPIYLPRQQETFYFIFNSGKGKIIADVYTFLVSPSPLNLKAIECVEITGNTKRNSNVECILRKVKKEEFDFEAKLKEWSSNTEVSELDLKDPKYNKYKTMNKAEVQSLKSKANKLTVKDPPPQRVYTIARKPTEPYMVSIPIHINSK